MERLYIKKIAFKDGDETKCDDEVEFYKKGDSIVVIKRDHRVMIEYPYHTIDYIEYDYVKTMGQMFTE